MLLRTHFISIFVTLLMRQCFVLLHIVLHHTLLDYLLPFHTVINQGPDCSSQWWIHSFMELVIIQPITNVKLQDLNLLHLIRDLLQGPIPAIMGSLDSLES